MNKIIGIYGAGGFGREVLPLVKEQFFDYEIYFIVDNPNDKKINDCKVFSYEDFISLPSKDKSVIFAIGNSKARESLETKCRKDNLSFASVRAMNSIILDSVDIGEGAVLCHFTQLTSNIKIGKQFHANIYSYVAHDCIIGDYVTFAPNVQCNGNVHIEDHAYIGTGAVIKQGTPEKPIVIGKGAIVGMGAVVTKSVKPGITVIGNPARLLSKSALRK